MSTPSRPPRPEAVLTIRVLLSNLAQQQCTQSTTRSSAQTMQHLEPLQAIRSLGLSSCDIQDLVDKFRAFGVVTLCPVVSGTTLGLYTNNSLYQRGDWDGWGRGTYVDKRIRPEQVPHASTLDVIQHGRLEIDLDRTRDVFLVGDFIKVDGKSVELDVS